MADNSGSEWTDHTRKAVLSYISAVITVRRENTPEWMEYIVECTNDMLRSVGAPDEVFIRPNGEISSRVRTDDALRA